MDVGRQRDRGTSWLCADEGRRERLLDMEQRLQPVRAATMAVLAVALLACGPWIGWWPLAPLVIALLAFKLVDSNLDRFPKPEWALAGAWMLTQVLIAVSVVLMGGADTPAVAWLAIPVVTLHARFDMRGVITGVAFTAVLIMIVTFGATPAAALDAPHRAIFPLGLLIGVAILSTALMRSDIDHRQDSVLDGLTGMLNRRSLSSRVLELAEQASITGEPIGLIVADLDHFKDVNDNHGHAVGDAVLVDVAYTIRKELRAFDLAYRLGGEEFLVVLPGATAKGARNLAERLRTAVERAPAGGLQVTMSCGVASSGGGTFNYETTFAAADAALYRAKEAGRNRVEAEGDQLAVAA